MSWGVNLAKGVFHAASRGAERILPPIVLWFLVWPLNELLAARYAWHSDDRVPATSLPLPANSRRPSFYRRWRYFSRGQTHWWLLGWIDRLSAAKWQRRLVVHGFDKLTEVLPQRPVIICSLHTTSLPVLVAWLRSRGVPSAAVPMDPTWFSSPARMRKTALAEKMGMAFTIRPGQPREMLDFLKPGHALSLTSDFTGGRVITVPWRGASVTVSMGLFRLARRAGAVVMPINIFETGRWRYEITVSDPVPEALIEAADPAAAARYVADCLYPAAIARPEQAMNVLVAAVR